MDKSIAINIIISIILLFIFTQYLYANDNIHIEIQSGRMGYFGSVHDILYTYSEKWELGAGIVYNISPDVELCGIFSYHRFELNNHIDLAGMPYQSYEIDAQPTHLYETSIAIRIMTSEQNAFCPYISLRTGFGLIIIGDENFKYTYNNTTSLVKTPSQKITNIFEALGLGYNFPISSRMNLKTELFWIEGTKVRYIGFMGAFQFSI
jgi:hypothetical protein